MRFPLIACLILMMVAGSAFAQAGDEKAKSDSTAVNLKTSLDSNETVSSKVEPIRANRTVFKSIGYGKVSEDQVLGSVTTLQDDEFQKNTYSNLAEYLRGRIPGLQVYGSPGNYSIIIRGVNTFNSSTQPLFVVDGTPVSASMALSMISPQDVKSVSVLKDGSAAIYGSRGANGVIIIETK